MGFRIVVSPAVMREMAEAYEWYRARNAMAASNSRAEVSAAFELIASDPKRWAVWSDAIRRHVLRQYPYAVYFTLVGEEVGVLAVGHQRRQAGYWRQR